MKINTTTLTVIMMDPRNGMDEKKNYLKTDKLPNKYSTVVN